MEPDEALGALCIMISFVVMLFFGHIFLAVCTIGMFYAFLKITGN